MGPGLFDRIREAAATVAGQARHVEVVPQALPVELVPVAPPEPTDIALVVTLGATAFGSGWFPHLRKLPGLSGARTLDARLRAHGSMEAAELASVTTADCAALFGQEGNEAVTDLLALLTRALNDLGRFLVERFGGSFEALVHAADGSAERLVLLLAEMPLYRDEAAYDGFVVPFYKRAQLTAADLARHGLARFDDLDRLTLFADNLVPHVLRVDGGLRYDDALAARIDAGELLAPGSEEEVEIRACAVHAVALLSEQTGCPAHMLDERLWWRGQQPHYKRVPRHRCRTPFY